MHYSLARYHAHIQNIQNEMKRNRGHGTGIE